MLHATLPSHKFARVRAGGRGQGCHAGAQGAPGGSDRGAAAVAAKIGVGSMVPMDVVVHKGFAGNTPSAPQPMSAFLKGKKVLLVSLPGAFTPT